MSIPFLFETVVNENSQNLALIHNNNCITYGELNAEANRLARVIHIKHKMLYGRQLPVGALITVCLEPSIELIISLLAILKAGAAYVPLDAHVPVQRLQFILQDTQSCLLITEKICLDKINEVVCEGIICWEEIKAEVVKTSKDNLNLNIQASDLAYIIYTSGTTGQPKGVMIPHSHVIQLFHSTDQYFSFNNRDVWTLFHSYAFDFSVWEIWGALLYGGCLVIVPYDIARDPKQFRTLLKEKAVTVLNQTPSAFQQLLDLECKIKDSLSSLRYIIFGGEALNIKVLDSWWKKYNREKPKLVNMYGITEITIHATYKSLELELLNKWGYGSNIGKALRHLKTHILDENLNPVPVGVQGELYISGYSLALGYLNREELTKECFIISPWNEAVRLYRTGDIARYLSNGDIEYLGRVDNQIKLRGYRIELAEIEKTLQRHEVVEQAVVILNDEEEHKRLVAYLVLKSKYKIKLEDLRAYLAQYLPEYMLPSEYLQISKLPLTSNGKIDRKALPMEKSKHLISKGHYEVIESSIERILAKIWRKLFPNYRIGHQSNFFSLGGNSLLAVQLTIEIKRKLKIDCPLKTIFLYPELKQLGAFIQAEYLKYQESRLSIPLVKRGREYPASFSQQRMWFVEHYEPDSVSYYNIPLAYHLYGPLSLKALEQSLSCLIARHESLHTVFSLKKNTIWQIIQIPYLVKLVLEVIKTELLAQALSEEAEKPFDLAQGPLLRFRLFKLEDNHYVFVFNHHHIISDGWSVRIFLKELSLTYKAYFFNKEPNLIPLKVQYIDYACWQHEQIMRGAFSVDKAYWQQRLIGITPLSLATDFVRPAVRNCRGSCYYTYIANKTLQHLQDCASETESTLFMVLLAGFVSLLSRYSNKTDIVIGSPIVNRQIPELENVIGCFINTLALRNDLNKNPSFAELIQRTKAVCIEAYDRQMLPFDQVIESLTLNRNTSYSLVFDVMFSFQSRQETRYFDLSEIKAEAIAIDYKIAKFDLTFTIVEQTENLLLEVEYNTDLYRQETIANMVRHFNILIEGASINPNLKLSELPILSQAEYRQVVLDWNQPDSNLLIQQTSSVSAVFEAQVQKNHEKLALIQDDRQFTYGELNAEANRLARVIHIKHKMLYGRQLPVGALITVCLEPSIELIISLLAILKTGAAYVPLDAHVPVQRLQFILQDTQSCLLITEKICLDKINEVVCEGIICWEEIKAEVVKTSKDNLNLNIQASDLAYIIYTSGTTGQPKGVMIEQKSIINLVTKDSLIQPMPEDKLVLAANIAFDAAVFEIWGALLNGASCYVVSKNKLLNFSNFIRFIKDKKINILFVTTALLSEFIRYRPNAFSSLRVLLFGGELVSLNIITKLLNHQDNFRLKILHVYGPTEATVFSTRYILTRLDSLATSVPIGRPLAGVQCYVLDNYHQSKAIGMPGELYIGGDGLARGYWKRPDLNAHYFISKTFHDTDGSVNFKRLYRTGDIARYLSNGDIEYLGRVDNQIKLRGYRIELAEIEKTLQRHEVVEQAVVILNDEEEHKRLVAYLVLKSKYKIKLEDLRAYLAQYLPEYMLPSEYLQISKLPLTSNGKIDRKALPMEKSKHLISKGHYEVIESSIERILAKIWRKLFPNYRIGHQSNFFSLGGNSLLAVQLTIEIKRKLKIDCPLKTIFLYPELKQLGAFIQAEYLKYQESRLSIPLVKRGREYPASFSQQRMWFVEHYEPDSVSYYNIPLAYHLYGPLSLKALEQSLSCLIARHESLHTVFSLKKNTIWQIIQIPYLVKLVLEVIKPELLAQALSEEAEKPFDLAQGPLLRFRLFKLEDNHYVFVFNHHHIISDGWSVRIFLKELSLTYKAYFFNKEPNLIPLKVQYIDYACWQHEQIMRGAFSVDKAYWQQRLIGITPLSLATDFVRPAVRNCRGSCYYTYIANKTLQHLQDCASETESTLFMVLLAGFVSLLSRYSNKTDIVIGSPIVNRQIPELENVIGCFINTLALRNDLNKNPSFAELIQRTKAVCIEAYDRQMLPFDQVIESLTLNRNTSYSLVFDVMFSFQSRQETRYFDLSEIKAEAIAIDYKIAKFDLTFTIVEQTENLLLEVEYNTDLYRQETIANMVRHFNILIEGASINPNLKLSELPILSQAEYRQVVLDWNQPDSNLLIQQTSSVSAVFEAQVQKNHEKLALIQDDRQFTYGELNAEANRLARVIHIKHKMLYGRQLPVGALITVCLEPSIELIISLLAILKTGAAYVPLDAHVPVQRLQFILQDTQSCLLITEKICLDKINEVVCEGIICWEEIKAEVVKTSKDNLNLNIQASDLAYIIYTSGTTGQPKGVMIPHSHVIQLFHSTDQYFSFNNRDVWTLFHSYAFDFSVWEIWGALLYGGCLVIVPYDIARDPKQFRTLLKEKAVTVLNQTPSAFQQLLDLECKIKDSLSSLRYIIFGGEALNIKVLDSWWKKYNREKPKLVNMYGITEITIHATYKPLELELLDKWGYGSNIGKALRHLKTHILDENLNPVPVGVQGELYISGYSLALGYLNREELTKECFIISPWNEAVRLYRTGDIARYLSNGDIEYLGRVDNQIKLRGYRIELAEIEKTLQRHEVVEQAVVILNDEEEHKRLVAYLVLKSKYKIKLEDLRAYLAQYLPEYMLPSEYLQISKLPLTSNGKIDRKVLPMEKSKHLIFKKHLIEPRSLLERELLDICKKLLKINNASIHDNFFMLGGDSILSIQFMSEARDNGIQFSLKEFFLNPTIAKLATVAKKNKKVTCTNQKPILGKAILTPIQEWFFKQDLANQNHFNQGFIFICKNKLDKDFLKIALEQLIKHHDVLRLRFFNERKELYFCSNYQTHLESIHEFCVEKLNLKQQKILVAEKCQILQKSLNLEKGPIMQAAIFSGYRDGKQRFLLIIHHLMIDGISWRILLHDIQDMYYKAQNKLPIRISFKKTFSYQSWANALYEYASNGDLKSAWRYWLSVGKNSSSLYCDKKGISLINANYCSYKISLNKEITSLLLTKVHHSYNTKINDILLSALLLAYCSWSKKSDLLIHLEGHGRETIIDLDVSRTVGWFTSIFPLHLCLPNTPDQITLSDLIIYIKEKLKTIEQKSILYGILRYLCNNKSSYELEKIDTALLCFNYLGTLSSSGYKNQFSFTNDFMKNCISETNNRTHILDISGWVSNGKLEFLFDYNFSFYNRISIIEFSNTFKTCLYNIVEHCIELGYRCYTPSDFNYTNTSQKFINSITSSINIEEIYETTPIQKGLLFHTLYKKNSNQYCVQLYCDLDFSLNKILFKKSWDLVISRYPTLRSSFTWKEVETPLQAIHKEVHYLWYEEDWRSLNVKIYNKKLSSYLKKDRNQGFDLEKANCMRFHLLKNAGSYTFIWTHHHILLDGWSISLLCKEISHIYNCLINLKKIRLLPVPDYSLYINTILKKSKEESIKFWKKELQGIKEFTPLWIGNFGKNISPIYNELSKPLSVSVIIPNSIKKKCLSLIKESHITFNTLLNMAWSIVLYKYTGILDIIMGITLSGRSYNLQDINKMVGLFINTVPLRVQLNKEKTIRIQLIELHQLIQEIIEHGDLPLNEIKQLTDFPKAMPLFYSLVIFENYPIFRQTRKKSILSLDKLQSYENTNYPLTLVFSDNINLTLKIMYDSKIFSNNMIMRLFNHLNNVLKAISSSPDRLLTNLQILGKKEYQYLINVKDKNLLHPKRISSSIAMEFETTASFISDKVAISHNKKEVTYGELNDKANQLAHFLKKQYMEEYKCSLKPNTLIAVYFYPGIELIISLLGILKAGAAYVPLDPYSPPVRLQAIMKDFENILVITKKRIAQKINSAKFKIIVWENANGEFKKFSTKNIKKISKCRDLAYVMYTSGTTGKQKGVMIEQGSVINLVKNNGRIKIIPNDKILCASSPAFDASTFEIWSGLLNGAKLCIIPRSILLDFNQFSNVLKTNSISILWLTSGLFDIYALQCPFIFKDISHLIVGGDVVNIISIEKVLSCFEGRPKHIWNGYGPTENTTFTTLYKVCNKDIQQPTLLIGKAINGVRCYILDQDLYPVPIGMPGELHVGGEGLARGYLHESNSIYKKFITNPFKKNLKIYKTGDYVRWLESGDIEYLGRLDNQVKIRGFRVDLREIEYALNLYTDILTTTALIRETKYKKNIVAFFVARKSSYPKNIELRNHLEKLLPEYMIPCKFIQLNMMPLTGNGKVDKDWLLKYDLNLNSTLEINRSYFSDPITSKLMMIWQKILQISHINLNDNFFHVGGDSLLILRLISEINKKFNKSYSISWAFTHNTLFKQSKALYAVGAVDNYTPMLEYNKKGRYQPLIFIHPGQSGAEVYHEMAQQLNTEHPFYTVQSHNLYSGQKIIETIEELATLYCSFIRKKIFKEPCYLGGWSLGGVIAYEIACQLVSQGISVGGVCMLDSMLFAHTELRNLDFSIIVNELINTHPARDLFSSYYKEHLYNTFLAEYQALKAFDPKVSQFKVTLFKANLLEFNKLKNSEELTYFYKAINVLHQDKYNGWSDYISDLDVHIIEGSHHSLISGIRLKKIVSYLENNFFISTSAL